MRYLLPAIVAWAIAQALKLALTSVQQRRLYLRALADTGGMPSSWCDWSAADGSSDDGRRPS